MSKKLVILGLALTFITFLGCKKKAQPINSKYVASTSWLAGIAELAGIDDVESIAPINLRHPPEYEITPNDILKVSQAEYFIVAGYERMMKTIATATEIDQNKIITVRTTNTLDVLERDVKIISEKAGTQEEAKKRFSEFKTMMEESRNKLSEQGIAQKTVFVNVNMEELATDLGLNIIGTFGPGPLTSEQIKFASENKIDIIIDNVHNPVAEPALTVSPESKLIIWRNFPEKKEKNAIYNIVKKNVVSLIN